MAGVLDKVNKLLTVKALRTRYSGDIGDVVVGRILEVYFYISAGFSLIFIFRLGLSDGNSMLILAKMQPFYFLRFIYQEPSKGVNQNLMNFKCGIFSVKVK